MLSFFTGTFSQFLQNFWQNFPRAIENAAAGHKWPAGPGLNHPALGIKTHMNCDVIGLLNAKLKQGCAYDHYDCSWVMNDVQLNKIIFSTWSFNVPYASLALD